MNFSNCFISRMEPKSGSCLSAVSRLAERWVDRRQNTGEFLPHCDPTDNRGQVENVSTQKAAPRKYLKDAKSPALRCDRKVPVLVEK